MTENKPPDTMSCPKCGLAGKPGQKFCNSCGTALVNSTVSPAATRKNVPLAAQPVPFLASAVTRKLDNV